MAFLIRDGFTLDGKIPALPGFYDEVRFKYRPALPARVSEYVRADKQGIANDIKILLEQLVSWNVVEDGSPVALNDAALRCVPHPALQTMVNHVMGYTATDWGEKEKNSASV